VTRLFQLEFEPDTSHFCYCEGLVVLMGWRNIFQFHESFTQQQTVRLLYKFFIQETELKF
jgi:hypothetical protein